MAGMPILMVAGGIYILWLTWTKTPPNTASTSGTVPLPPSGGPPASTAPIPGTQGGTAATGPAPGSQLYGELFPGQGGGGNALQQARMRRGG